jgi:hypothetical protein
LPLGFEGDDSVFDVEVVEVESELDDLLSELAVLLSELDLSEALLLEDVESAEADFLYESLR